MSRPFLFIIIGGTSIRGALAYDHYSIDGLHFGWIEETAKTYSGLINTIKKIYSLAIKDNPRAIVLGIPGRVNPDTNCVLLPPVFGEVGEVDFKKKVHSELGLPVVIENDANLMALGEFAARRYVGNSLALIVIGTGIGGALITHGQLVKGATGIAGEVGYLNTFVDGKNCTVRELSMGKTTESVKTNATNIIIAIGVIARAFILTVDPEIIVLTGGMIPLVGCNLISDLRKELEKNCSKLTKDSFSKVRIEASSLQHNAAIIGAIEIMGKHFNS